MSVKVIDPWEVRFEREECAWKLLTLLHDEHVDMGRASYNKNLPLNIMPFAAWARKLFSKDDAEARKTSEELSVAIKAAEANRLHPEPEEEPGDFYARIWDDYGGHMHDNDAPDGTYQHVYWLDSPSTIIARRKYNGVWKYDTKEK